MIYTFHTDTDFQIISLLLPDVPSAGYTEFNRSVLHFEYLGLL